VKRQSSQRCRKYFSKLFSIPGTSTHTLTVDSTGLSQIIRLYSVHRRLSNHWSKPLTESSSSRFQQVCLAVARFSAGAWVGGAVLFVITSVAEQVHPRFDSAVRDQLAAIRFPLYYLYCWCCLGLHVATSLINAWLCRKHGHIRPAAAAGIATAALLMAIADHQFVYQPLLDQITPPGKPRTQEFIRLHNASRMVNQIHVGLAALAGMLICLPLPTATPTRRHGLLNAPER
jgi:hypothetical protein